MQAHTQPERRIVQRDRDRFSKFHPDSRAVIPPDAGGEIEWKPIRVLIDERIAALRAADTDGAAAPATA